MIFICKFLQILSFKIWPATFQLGHLLIQVTGPVGQQQFCLRHEHSSFARKKVVLLLVNGLAGILTHGNFDLPQFTMVKDLSIMS